MGYRVVPKVEGYGPRPGLEGPFQFSNGAVYYYDPKEGAYYDPRTDFYLSYDEVQEMNGHLVAMLKGER